MPVRTAALAASLATAALAAVPATAAADASTLTVDGSGTVFVVPDRASLSVDVNVTSDRSRTALSLANRRTDAIVAGVRGVGVDAGDIQTDAVNVHRSTIHVGPKGHRHAVVRYIADEQLSISSSTTLVGRVIDTAVRLGATAVDGPSFSFSDPSAGEIAATNAAIADARRRADAAAAQMGYKVTGVQSVNLNPGSTYGAPGAGGSVNATSSPSKSAPTPTTVRPGRQEVDAEVEVVYTIAPA